MWPQVALLGLGWVRRHRKLIVVSVAACALLAVMPLVVMVAVIGQQSPAAQGGGVACTGQPAAAPPAASDGSPTILGPSTLTAGQIAAWWATTSPGPDTMTTVGMPVATLAAAYVSNDDGVRGDVAFAQAVVETGGFTSSDAVGRFNFAGIAHPGLAPGAPFPDPLTGVVAQVQLLADVAAGPIAAFPEPRVAPQWGGRRVATWAGLTGNWAVATDYWTAISSVYQRMLAGAGVPGPVGGPVLLGAAACAQAQAVLASASAPDIIRAAITFALGKVGLPYVWGGTGPGGYDCSGLVQAAYASAGVALPRTTYGQVLVGQAVATPADLLAGDVVFPDAGHEQLYLGGGLVVEAQQTGVPIHVVPLWGQWWQARRVVSPAGAQPPPAG